MDDAASSPRLEPAPVYGTDAAAVADRPFPGVWRETHQTERATVTAYAFEPGASFPSHSHSEEQITVVLAGEAEFTVDGTARRLGPGETFVLAAGVEHGLTAGPAGARFLAVIVPRRERPDAYEIRSDE
jgi:quercetin dioxygenase-like cupin family protein